MSWDPDGAWRVSESGCGVAQLHVLLGSPGSSIFAWNFRSSQRNEQHCSFWGEISSPDPRPHRWSPSAESWKQQEKAPSHSCGLFHQEADTEVSSKLLSDLCMAVHSFLLRCSNCKARVYEVQWLSNWRKSSVTLGYCGLRMWSFVSCTSLLRGVLDGELTSPSQLCSKRLCNLG